MNTLIIFSEVLPNTSRDLRLLVSFWHYSGFGTKLSPIFGFAKSFQVQNHFSIKPNA